MRRRDRPVPLITGEMREPRAERLAPLHGVAPVAGMPEVERIAHIGNEAPYQFGIAAITVAGEHQRAAADRLATRQRDAFDEAILLVGEQRFANASCEDRDIARLDGRAETVDQFRTAAARQAVHAVSRSPG